MDVVHDRLSEEEVLKITFADIIKILESTLRLPEDAIRKAQEFQSLTARLYLRPDVAILWCKDQQRQGLLEAHMIKFFKDTCILLLDRYEETRPFIIKGCCQLCIVGGELGRQAVAIAADACRDSAKQEVVAIILEVISPLMEVTDSLPIKLQHNLMTSLTQLPHMQEFAVCLQPFIHNIVEDIVKDPWETEYIGLLKTACLDEDNLVDLLQYKLPERVIPQLKQYELINGPIYANEAHLEAISHVLEIVGLTMRGVPAPLLSQFIGDTIIPNLKDLIGEREGTARLTAAEARICNLIIRLCTAAIVSSQNALEELCFGYHLFDLLVVPVKEPVAEPLVLAAALTCLIAIMRNPKNGDTFINTFTEDVDLGILMGYLRPESIQKLVEIHNKHAITLVSSISNFIAHLLELAPKQPRVQQLMDNMYEKGLVVMIMDAIAHSAADIQVRGALVRALVRLPLERIDAGAITIMLELLVPASIREFEPEVFEYIMDALKLKLEVYAMETIIERTCWLLIATLKTPEAHRYHVVHLKCAALLQKASGTKSGRMILRNENHALSLRKALKYEEEFCEHDHPEVRVELASAGGDVAFLSACMFDTFRLKSDSKQIFRVLRALNLAISDAQHGHLEEKMQHIEAICAQEVEDFAEEPLKHIAVFAQDSSIEGTENAESDSVNTDMDALLQHDILPDMTLDAHRDREQQLFVSMEMPQKIMAYLSAAFSTTFTERFLQERKRNQHSEYWAGLLKGRKLDCERLSICDKFDWNIDCSDIFSGESLAEGTQLGEAISSAIAKPTRHTVSYVINKKLGDNNHDKRDDDIFYWVVPRQLLHKVWINESTKILNPCFVVSSYLRTLHVLMAPHVSSVVREAIKGHFKDPDFVRNLIKLTACSSFLDANLTAKLFRVCVRALTIDVSAQAESMDVIIVYDILSRFAAGVCEPLMSVVTSVSVDWVESSMYHVQLVLLRIFQLFAMIARQMPCIKFSNVLEIQQYFVEKCVIRFLTEPVLSLVLRILFQIVALETSSSVGTYVSHLYQSHLLEQIREACADIVVTSSCAAKHTHYQHLINAISEQRQSNSLLLRPSFVADLLRRIQLAELSKQFQDRVSEKRLERALLMDDIWIAKKGGPIRTGLLGVTSRNMYILRSRRESDFKIRSKFHRNAAVWEVENGLLYVVFARQAIVDKTSWTDSTCAMFTLRHTPSTEFRRFVTEGNSNILGFCSAKTLGKTATYLGICNHDEQLSLIALTENKLAIFAIKPNIITETIIKGKFMCELALMPLPEDSTDDGNYSSVLAGKVVETDSNRKITAPESEEDDEETSEAPPEEPLELLQQWYCDSITKVAYGDDLGVAITVKDSHEEDDDDGCVWEVTFVSDGRREAFKKALARSIGHLAWFRHWERS
ncbi:uncharacterized protein BXIN_0766 [Babesia sp. Xinjiang]|uniref:uncharacterized protein n=1 Tax=Babesia sp. Xinjiang TaxID=462227 RepID=UPI000A240DA9|nr:uncharacterized protein BXIN_0766 [Babesia sp. Xinjiang]ORM41354.1 hypothetical protein BXIN_0766 [Babesia sp. Xinjiang]